MNRTPRRELARNLVSFPATLDDLITNFWGTRPQNAVEGWKPDLDLKETPEAYILKVEIPGIDPDDIDIQVSQDSLQIRGERREEEKREGENWHVVERSYGSFFRTIDFPSNVQSDAVEAETEDGILTLTIPKSTDRQPKKITVKAS